jgi:hypothetical protein
MPGTTPITVKMPAEMNKAGTIELMFPTIRTLESLRPFKEVEELLEYARTPKPKTLIAPFTATARNGDQHILIPGDFAYTEVRKIDPDNKGSAHSFIEPGQPVAIGTHITRVTAANPGMMTGPGTNTYLIGDAQTGVAVIDPGPLLEEHIQNAIQSYSLTYGQNGVVNKRMTFSEVYIPSVNENTGLNYYPNDFALSVVKYLKDIVS